MSSSSHANAAIDLDALERNWQLAKALNMPTKVTAEFPELLLALIQRLRKAEAEVGHLTIRRAELVDEIHHWLDRIEELEAEK